MQHTRIYVKGLEYCFNTWELLYCMLLFFFFFEAMHGSQQVFDKGSFIKNIKKLIELIQSLNITSGRTQFKNYKTKKPNTSGSQFGDYTATQTPGQKTP